MSFIDAEPGSEEERRALRDYLTDLAAEARAGRHGVDRVQAAYDDLITLCLVDDFIELGYCLAMLGMIYGRGARRSLMQELSARARRCEAELPNLKETR